MFRLFPTFRNLGTILRNNVTRPGRALLFLLFFCSLGLIYLDSPILYLFTSIFSIMLLAGIFSFLFRPNIGLQIIAPDLVQAGEEVKADLYVSNLRNRSAFELFVEPDDNVAEIEIQESSSSQLINVIRPGKTTREHLKFTVTRRGVYSLPDVKIGSTFPFNLFRIRQTKKPDETIIATPAFHPIRDFELPTSNYTVDFDNENNIQFANSSGAAEYIGNREYQEGMPVRRWDYPSWARTGKPTVREYRENQQGTATVFIDNFFEDAKNSADDFEALLSLATAVVDAVTRHHVQVSRLIIGTTVFSIVDATIEDQIRSIGRKLALAETMPESESGILLDEIFLDQAIGDRAFSFLLFNKMSEEREYFQRQFLLNSNATLTRVLTTNPESQGETGISREAILQGEVFFK